MKRPIKGLLDVQRRLKAYSVEVTARSTPVRIPDVGTQGERVWAALKAGCQTSREIEIATDIYMAAVAAKLSRFVDEGLIKKIGEVERTCRRGSFAGARMNVYKLTRKGKHA